MNEDDEFANCTPTDCAKCPTQHCLNENENKDHHEGLVKNSSNIVSSTSDKVTTFKKSKGLKMNVTTQKLLFKIDFLLMNKSSIKPLYLQKKNNELFGSLEWIQPASLVDLISFSSKSSKIISGNTEVGVEVKFKHSGLPNFQRYNLI